MFHNKHTIPLGILAALMESGDLRLVNRTKIPLPGFMLIRPYRKLLKEVAESVNKSGLEKEIQDGILKAKIYNKAFNLYPALVNIVSISWDKKHLDLIKEITGIELKKLDDREFLISETKRLQDKYKEFIKEEKPEGVSFAQVIVSTELILDMSIDRNIKLYEFQYYLKAATDKIKQLDKLT